MQWFQRDPLDMYILSDEGYRISKSFGPGFRYCAWPPRDRKDDPAPVLTASHSLDECKAACEAHLADDSLVAPVFTD